MRLVNEVEAAPGGGGGALGDAGAVEEFHGDAVDAGLAGILDAVGVEVIPDEVAEGGGLIEACVPGDVILAGDEGGGGGVAGGGVGIRVDGVIGALIGGGEGIA